MALESGRRSEVTRLGVARRPPPSFSDPRRSRLTRACTLTGQEPSSQSMIRGRHRRPSPRPWEFCVHPSRLAPDPIPIAVEVDRRGHSPPPPAVAAGAGEMSIPSMSDSRTRSRSKIGSRYPCEIQTLLYHTQLVPGPRTEVPGDGRKPPSVPVIFQRGLAGCKAALNVEFLNIYIRGFSLIAAGPVG